MKAAGQAAAAPFLEASRSREGDPAFLRRAYYLLKPYLPKPFRVFLRQVRAERRRKQFADTWPIDPAAGTTPAQWPGWPGGKRFAVVLTHDVEGSKGVARCEQLAALEAERGFRSSFNFIPEGEYRVAAELRKALVDGGFEVGVHDLKHDGHLYASQTAFERSARRINEYLQEWNAVGFRSGFMHHNLAWIGKLNILYDASTFDTDPFEPQPDGVGSIFPLWVCNREGTRGYVELPYTLTQDFTMFVVLKEEGINVWKRKLDWIAERGGMALVNVHPDYVSFDRAAGPQEFKASLYCEFLDYIRLRYEGQYWGALPKDVAAYAGSHRSALRQENLL